MVPTGEYAGETIYKKDDEVIFQVRFYVSIISIWNEVTCGNFQTTNC